MRVPPVNPSNHSFGIGVITSRRLFVMAAATRRGTGIRRVRASRRTARDGSVRTAGRGFCSRANACPSWWRLGSGPGRSRWGATPAAGGADRRIAPPSSPIPAPPGHGCGAGQDLRRADYLSARAAGFAGAAPGCLAIVEVGRSRPAGAPISSPVSLSQRSRADLASRFHLAGI